MSPKVDIIQINYGPDSLKNFDFLSFLARSKAKLNSVIIHSSLQDALRPHKLQIQVTLVTMFGNKQNREDIDDEFSGFNNDTLPPPR